MKKTLVFLTAAVMLLGLVTGCTFWGTQNNALHLTASSTSGHPGPNGMVVTFAVSGGSGTYSLDPGDGSPIVETNSLAIQHAYTATGTYEAVVSSGGASKIITIHVTNNNPIVYPAFTPSPYEWMEKMAFDARYRVHGCDENGAPVSVTGVRDPDGDNIVAYEWSVTGPDKNGQTASYSIFDPRRNNITGKKTDNAVVVCFLGWTNPNPPYPFYQPMCGVTPTPTPPPVKTLGTMTVTLRAYDQWGGVGTITWTHTLQSSACSH